MVKGGFQHQSKSSTNPHAMLLSNSEVLRRAGLKPLAEFILEQQTRWYGHVIRRSNLRLIKRAVFETEPGAVDGAHHPQSSHRHVLHHYKSQGLSHDETHTQWAATAL